MAATIAEDRWGDKKATKTRRVLPPSSREMRPTRDKTQEPGKNEIALRVKPRAFRGKTPARMKQMPFLVSPSAIPVRSLRRRVVCGAIMDIVDDETWGPNETVRVQADEERILDPRTPLPLMTLEQGCGGEVYVSVSIAAEAMDAGDVKVTIDCSLWEGTSEAKDDLDGTAHEEWMIPADSPAGGTIYVWNTDEGGDFAEIKLSFTNYAA